MRSQAQVYWDNYAILSLFDSANRIGSIDGNLKIQKLGFIFELKGQEKNLKSAHYRFFRYNNGPYSRFLANDVLLLKAKGFISSSNQLTKRGHFLTEFVGLNTKIEGLSKEAIKISEEVSREFGKYSGPKLTSIVYKMTVPVIDLENKPMKVRDIDVCTDILDPVRNPESREIHLFGNELIADLNEEFEISSSRLDPGNLAVREEVISALEHTIQSGR
jgi:uncharacterized protein YwgA